MAQRNRGLHGLLSFSLVHRTYHWLLGADSFQRRFADQYVRAADGQRVLDLGCGTANILRALPSVEYVGYDLSERYVETARREFGDRGTFQVGQVAELEGDEQAFDIVLAVGLLHHLDDEEAARLFQISWSALKPGGRLVTIDPTLVRPQHWFARWLIKRDRGMNVRGEEQLLELARKSFPRTKAAVRHDLLRIPFTHVILEAVRD